MKKLLLLGATLFAVARTLSATTIDFEDLIVPAAGYENGSNLNGSFVSRGARFNNNYSATFDSWTQFSYANKTDTVTPGFLNQYSAWTGGGSDGRGGVLPGSNYGVAYVDPYSGNPNDLPAITLGAGEDTPISLRLTNTTYAALTMRDGGAFGAVKFGGASGNAPDYLKLTISGLDAGGSLLGAIDYYLADFRPTDNALDYIVNDWRLVDLTSLGSGVAKLRFSMESSQPDGFGGYTTPLYFALDDVRAVPEPSSLLYALGLAAVAGYRRRRLRA